MGEPAKTEGQHQGEKLSVEEIWRRYPNEWVVLVDNDWTNMTVTEGVVFGHSPLKSAAEAMARDLARCAVFWTGTIQSPTSWYLTHVRRPV